MWSAISKDFMSFASNMKEESHAVMGALSRLAADVVGEDGVYAGDNASQEAKDMPIDVDVLLKFQEDYRTYTEPLSDLEHTVFSDWAATSPFSSLHAAARQAQQTGKTTHDEALAASPSPSQTWRDEPTDEVRQRLLDCSEAVLDKYVELVGDMVSPRMSSLRKSTSISPQSHPKNDATPTATTTDKPADGSFPSPSSTATAAAAGVDATPPTFATPTPARPAGSPSGAGLLTEDDFFDRYFFRLAQLRCQVAEQRREQQQFAEEQKRQQRAQQEQKQREAASLASASRQARDGARPSPQAAAAGEHVDDDDDQGRDDEDVAVPLFAKKVLSAASGFMNAMDSALIGPTSGRDPGGSDEDNVSPEMLGAGAAKTGMTADQRRNTSRASLHEQIAGLESVVQELQDELRRESARSQQLEALLHAHGITVPEPPHITPEKPHAPLVVASTPPLVAPATAAASAGQVKSSQSPSSTPAATTVQHVDVAVPTPSATPTVGTSPAASLSGSAAAPPLPPTPPAFKPFTASSTPMASPPGASVGATPGAAPSPPVFSSSAEATPMGSRPIEASPLSSKKNE